MNSLSTRLLIAASIMLIFFLGLTALIVDRAFRQSAEAMELARLQVYTYDLLRDAEQSRKGTDLYMPKLPSKRFLRPHSGLYASVIAGNDNRIIWLSPSAAGMNIPFMRWISVGRKWFGEVVMPDGTRLFSMSYSVLWVDEAGHKQIYIFSVAESQNVYEKQVHDFRSGLWFWFGGIVSVLLLVQWLILRWGLLPLRRVSQNLQAIEAGTKERLEGNYPQELRGLTDNLNGLLLHERQRQQRYRNALADLAHSVKTPLAVLRSVLETAKTKEELSTTVVEQIQRLDQLMSYQLQRAVASGQVSLAKPVLVYNIATKIVAALAKVYASKGVHCQMDIPSELFFCGEEGDLLELLGNLLDNAYKWCSSSVQIAAMAAMRQGVQGIQLVIEDDGPGIPSDQMARVLQRGERADPTMDGHGIGLAVADDIVRLYGGQLIIGAATRGGARIELFLAR
jgi:two-component system, OmpR family, sensor histidine kinase PhoQ